LNVAPGDLLAAAAATFLGSLFAAGDAALHALAAPRLQVLTGEESGRGACFRRYASDPVRIVSRWLVGRVVCISLAAALIHDVAERRQPTGFGPMVAVLAVVATYGTFAEVGATFARRRPEFVGALALRFLQPLEWILLPLAAPLAMLGRFVADRLPLTRTVDARTAETEVEWIVAEGEKAGAIGNEPAEMIRKVLDFKDLTAREVMVPRRLTQGIELGTSLDRVFEIVSTEGHSRYPVYRGSLDNVVGLLYAKDLFAVVRDKLLGTTRLADLLRTPVFFVSETQPVAKILPEMQVRRLHLAIVVDEFGGTSGLITLEDIVEEIVGDIRDEYDTEAQIKQIGDGHLVVDAAVSLTDLGNHLGRRLPADAGFESLGGLIVHRAGRVPLVGAILSIDGLKLIVREADERRVVKVEIVVEHSIPEHS
jgi:CBS domain containing-hemolysin-like protein